MDVKDYLLTSKKINRDEIARLMWPKNATAGNYLTSKLHGTGGRSFTLGDAGKAIEVLRELRTEIVGLTIADTY